MPALHCSMTSFGLLMMNSGEPMTGSERPWRARGSRTCDLRQGRRAELVRRRTAGFRASAGSARTARGQPDQNASTAIAITLSAPSTMLSRGAGRARQDVLGIEARGGDLGLHEGGVLALGEPVLGHQQRARQSASRPPGCRPASGRAPSRRTPRSGCRLVSRGDEVDDVDEGLARRGQPAQHRLGCRRIAPRQFALGLPRSAPRWPWRPAPPSRAVLRPTRSLAWIAVVPS